MSKDAFEFMRHILTECDYIISAVTPDSEKNDLLNDETLKRAVVRSLEIIGEASRKIPVDVKMKYPDVEWKKMPGMRDRLIHDYLGVNYSIVWDVTRNIIPSLREQIRRILADS